ncbi:C-type lectin domain family 2 member B-like isoform X1 [Malaclemys terrapin pileata]|uniref:C-type lectin domain family 2 member B-like isoform X1 n=1 Tax=Malaclemys terrapin pileata TaxID=2991368 RepID=UPI0023A89433|nr:C-type lectin domain family 2 member B-like isoform X1 [Malaclemys terrapin pileata]
MAAELRTPEQGPKPWERSVLDSGYGSSIHQRSQRPLDSPEAGEVVVEKFSLSGAECESGPNSPEAAASDSGRSGHVVTSGCSLLAKDEEPGVRVASPEQRSAAGACPPVTRCGQCSNIVWKVITGVLAVVILVLLLTGTLSPKVRQCPEDWIGFGGNCYYFSTDTKSWDDSKEYCASHGATLPVIKEKLQLENIKRLRQNHYYWIGLRKEAAGWQWDDGSLFTNDVIQLENEDAKLKCSFLNSDKIVTVDCTSSRRWICVKESK